MNFKIVIHLVGSVFTKKLNGYQLGDYALKTGGVKQMFLAKNTFAGITTKGIIATGSIAGFNFQNHNYLLANKNQTFTCMFLVAFLHFNEKLMPNKLIINFYSGRDT